VRLSSFRSCMRMPPPASEEIAPVKLFLSSSRWRCAAVNTSVFDRPSHAHIEPSLGRSRGTEKCVRSTGRHILATLLRRLSFIVLGSLAGIRTTLRRGRPVRPTLSAKSLRTYSPTLLRKPANAHQFLCLVYDWRPLILRKSMSALLAGAPVISHGGRERP
jgi:hypothetical protein